MPRRPPKWWMDRCIAGVEASGSAADPKAVCGDLWFKKLTDAQRRARLKREVNPPELRREAMQDALRARSRALVPQEAIRPLSRAERREERLMGLFESLLEHEDVIAPLIGAAGGAAAFYPLSLEPTGLEHFREGPGFIEWFFPLRVSNAATSFLPTFTAPGILGGDFRIGIPNEITVSVKVPPGVFPDPANFSLALDQAKVLARVILTVWGLGIGAVAVELAKALGQALPRFAGPE